MSSSPLLDWRPSQNPPAAHVPLELKLADGRLETGFWSGKTWICAHELVHEVPVAWRFRVNPKKLRGAVVDE